ncbi:5-(carboxyamino)imidazole ribonucleotide synthase [Halalkalicoccus ordinarius]|uniref:5-(carboxyamino)imidazole ribonucleotide synthase n=1 Tax=Halalkalicoccus ordinarius TaxID=3116651 RepID=UPI00300EA958
MYTLSSPGPTLGVVGGGQLGRMMAEAAAPLGVELLVLDPTPDCPAAPVARDQIVADFDDPEAIRELVKRSDALTFEIELADPDVLESAGEERDVPVEPSPDTLRTIQDKLVQKRALVDAGIAVPEFRAVSDAEDLRDALSELGGEAMVKARRGGYDGRGNAPIDDPADAEATLEEIGGEAMVEEMIEFDRELSVIGVKGEGEIATYVVGENVHEEEILRETVVPARTDEAIRERAQSVARDVLSLMDGRGTYGIELFEWDGEILVNEIAPRPHNSGHWTIEGADSSQFEQHVRAVLGLPLGSTALRDPVVSKNLLGDEQRAREARLSGGEQLLAEPSVHLHWYGKREVRPLRKMGHFTVLGEENDSLDELLESARTYRRYVEFEA